MFLQTATGGFLTVTLIEPLAPQFPTLDTVTFIVTGLMLSADQVMVAVPWPLVSRPSVMLQRYVAPAPASGTDATLPVELVHTEEGVVMLVLGAASTPADELYMSSPWRSDPHCVTL